MAIKLFKNPRCFCDVTEELLFDGVCGHTKMTRNHTFHSQTFPGQMGNLTKIPKLKSDFTVNQHGTRGGRQGSYFQGVIQFLFGSHSTGCILVCPRNPHAAILGQHVEYLGFII